MLVVPSVVQFVCVCVHVLPEQHGCAMPPHVSQMDPLVQTCCVPPMEAHADPAPTHFGLAAFAPVSQQPCALHWSPGQHASPGLPHGTHAVPWHTVVALHASDAPTHVCVDGLQQPPLHTLPEQQVSPM